MLKIKQELCKSANQINEDITGYGDYFALVLDGSTGLTKKTLDNGENLARWYVTSFKRNILKWINSELNLSEIIIKCILDIKDEFEKIYKQAVDKVDLPSASIVVIRIQKDSLEVFSLGDCTTIIKDKKEKCTIIHDDTVTKLDNIVIEKMIEIRKKTDVNIVDARAKVNNLLIENRHKKNTSSGYWILGFEKEAVNHAYYRKFNLKSIDKIYMMSDGMAEYYEELGLANSIDEFIKEVDKNGVNSLYNKMRKVQEEDKLCNTYPRIKPKDDVSIIICEI